MSEETLTVPAESTSLAEHESTYVHPESPVAPAAEPPPVPEPVAQPALGEADPDDPERPERPDAGGERDEHGRWKPRDKHRAKSQHATAADVPRIAALTKKLRETEERAAALEAQMKAPRPAPVPEAPKEFTDQEPQYADFANEDDPYAAHVRALTAYDRKKEAFEAQKTSHDTAEKTAMEQRNQQRDAWFQTRLKSHGERIEKLFASNPQAEGIIEKANVDLNPVMLAAVLAADNSEHLALALAQNPDLVDDLHLLTDDKSPSRDLVAYVQRRMSRGLQVGTTGSTAPAPVVPALPRPPNPVRTGAMKPADAPPGDDASLSEHERAYGSGGGRRRR